MHRNAIVYSSSNIGRCATKSQHAKCKDVASETLVLSKRAQRECVPEWGSEHNKSQILERVAPSVFIKPTVVDNSSVASPNLHSQHPCVAVKMRQDGMRRSILFTALSDSMSARNGVLATQHRYDDPNSFQEWSSGHRRRAKTVRVAS